MKGEVRSTVITVVVTLLMIPCVLTTIYFWYPSKTVVHKSIQPSSVDYQRSGGYQIQITHDHRNQFRMWICRKGDDGFISYGHEVDFSQTNSNTTVTRTDWKTDGIDVVFSSGHRVFIPKASFIGGR